ncbi:MAG: ABC transporter ATP-binding protein [Methanomassiliicoccales archaeon]|nr:MAG: ABC transporter ATP-binding protein [Methanomassiliicoccales archaeon]
MPKTIISTKDVVKIYDTGDVKVTALNGISLNIIQGEMVSVMGPSGCGKTTLLNCLSGIDDVTEGEINIDGKNIANLNDFEKSAYRARNIGFIFQFYNLLPVLTAQENVELPLLLAKRPQKEAKKTALKMLELVGLKDWATHKPAELSGGQRQRVTIARALANTPAIVFADEPTGDLDSKNSDEIIDLLMNLNRCEGITFLIVTHDPNVGKNVPRKITMKDGQIQSDVRNKDYDFDCPEAYTDKRFFKND